MRVLKLTTVCLLAAGLGGCVTTQDSYVQNSGYGQVVRFPTVADPAAAALIDRAEKDLTQVRAAGDAFFDLSLGKECPLDRSAKPVDTYRLVVLSGECPQPHDLAFHGPVEYIAEMVTRHDSSSLVGVNETKFRATGVYINGKPVGEHVMFVRGQSNTFNRLASGELIEFKSGQPELPSYTVSYNSHSPDGNSQGNVSVTFSWLDAASVRAMTVVNRWIDNDRRVSDSYFDGKLVSRTRTKNEQLHGWTENFQPGLVRAGHGKQCYQNGQLIKAVECPDT